MTPLTSLALLLPTAFLGVAGLTPPTAPQPTDAPEPLKCFEVTPPVRGPSGPVSSTVGSVDGSCTVRLMEHGFGWSYGKPFVDDYTPPSECGDFNRVIVNLTVTAVGRQFDRLAMMFLGDTEVWRSSTAEPNPGTPIVWTQWADMTPYLALWRQPQRLVFDLGNLVDETYTGIFQTTLTATFFKVDEDEDNDNDDVQRPADVIVPVTGRRSHEGKPSHWVYPGTEKAATSVTGFPRNARRAVLAISANGQMAEEFWWANQLESDRSAFPPEKQPGMSPFREVQVLIDGEVAGMQWPFPVVFTGGYAPNMHRPMVGIGAFTLRESEVDVSAWLPVLCDGRDHAIELVVMGVVDDGKGGSKLAPVTGQYWVLSAKLFVWLDEKDTVTTGDKPKVTLADPTIEYHSTLKRNATGDPEALLYDISVDRQIKVVGSVGKVEARWTQKVSFNGTGDARAYSGYQAATLHLSGEDTASGPSEYHVRYSYPASLVYDPTYNDETDEHSVSVELNQTRDFYVQGASAFTLDSDAFTSPSGQRYHAYASTTTRNASAVVVRKPGQQYIVRRDAVAEQLFQLNGWTGPDDDAGQPDELYTRAVKAVNDRVSSDSEAFKPAGQDVADEQDRWHAVVERRLEDDFAPAAGAYGRTEWVKDSGKELGFSLWASYDEDGDGGGDGGIHDEMRDLEQQYIGEDPTSGGIST